MCKSEKKKKKKGLLIGVDVHLYSVNILKSLEISVNIEYSVNILKIFHFLSEEDILSNAV